MALSKREKLLAFARRQSVEQPAALARLRRLVECGEPFDESDAVRPAGRRGRSLWRWPKLHIRVPTRLKALIEEKAARYRLAQSSFVLGLLEWVLADAVSVALAVREVRRSERAAA